MGAGRYYPSANAAAQVAELTHKNYVRISGIPGMPYPDCGSLKTYLCVGLLILETKEFIDAGSQGSGDVVRQPQGRVILPLLQKYNRLPPDAYPVGQGLLGKVMTRAVFLYSRRHA